MPARKGPLTAMQIRLTVVDPLGPPSEPRGRATACDVLVTAPAGTALAAVASGLASAVGEGGAERLERSREVGGGQVVLYAGAERLDVQRCTLGEPPLIDGAVLSLGAPSEPGPEVDEAAAQLHVVAGPDAGGVHLLHGGKIHIGRSADADVPLDDPDVSRLHCAVTLSTDGRVSVVDLGSTNGTTLDGTRVGDRPVRLAPGALLRIGESALRLASSSGARGVGTTPDGEGHVRVAAGPGRRRQVTAAPTAAPGPAAWLVGVRERRGPEFRARACRAADGAGAGRVPGIERTTGSTGPGTTGAPAGAAPSVGQGPVPPVPPVREGAGEGGGAGSGRRATSVPATATSPSAVPRAPAPPTPRTATTTRAPVRPGATAPPAGPTTPAPPVSPAGRVPGPTDPVRADPVRAVSGTAVRPPGPVPAKARPSGARTCRVGCADGVGSVPGPGG
ncbi:FHA domain-containing protein [Streptomyces sp. MNU76]|uniref:FHA domain-containing protein n=1 Tax=Streptomyces sp. MNU76 TaxID=2560026 RepID=UPI0035A8D52D